MIPANEVRDRVLKQHAADVARAEEQIDRAILQCDTVGANVVVIVSGYLHQVVCDRLAEYYRDGGWHISHERHRATDQRDDDRTTFTLRPAESPPVARVVPMMVERPETPPQWVHPVGPNGPRTLTTDSPARSPFRHDVTGGGAP